MEYFLIQGNGMTQSRPVSDSWSGRYEITEFGKKAGRRKLTAAVFLDRDGVVIEDRHYLSDPGKIRFIPGSLIALRRLQDKFRLIVVTNQSGVARGLFAERELISFHHQLLTLLASQQVYIDGIYYCPHHPTLGRGEYLGECSCRKPEPGLIQQATRDFELNLDRSFLVGDKESDVMAGKKAGVYTVLLQNEDSAGTAHHTADFRAHTWADVLSKILASV